MTQLIFNRADELADWAEIQSPEIGDVGRPCEAIGIASNDGKLMAVAIYNNFTYYNGSKSKCYDVHMTFVAATPRWATSGNIRAVLDYPFNQLGVKRMTSIINKDNKRARKLNEGVGFKLEGMHPFGNGGKGRSCTYGLYHNVVKERWFNG